MTGKGKGALVDLSFLSGGGEMGALMRAKNWAATSLGEPSGWPQGLRTILRVILTTNHPAFVFWGPDHVCFYNDAYRNSIGPEKHPDMLGARGREMWDEIWPIIGPQITQVLSGGGATWHENQLVPIIRNGQLEDVYWTYSYGPIDDPTARNGIGGVLVLCTETTAKVLSEQRLAKERTELADVFAASPSFVAVLNGPTHVFQMVNPAYARLVRRDVVGKTVREAIPDIAGQGFYELLDQVYATGERYIGSDQRVDFIQSDPQQTETRWLNFVYEPMRDGSGNVTGIFVEGSDVTELHDTREDAQRSAERAETVAAQLQTVLDAVPAAIWIAHDADARVITGNGYSRDLLRLNFGQNMSLTADPSSAPTGFSVGDRDGLPIPLNDLPVQRAARGEVVQDFEEQIIFDDGVTIHLIGNAQPLISPDGEPRGAVAAFIDITRRKQAETALRDLAANLEKRVDEALQEKSVLATIVETTDAFIQVVDKDFNWIAINQSAADEFERIFGPRPAVGISMLEVLKDLPEHQAQVRDLWARALAGEEFTTVEEFGDSARDRRAYEIRFNTLRDKRGEQIGAFQIVTDVSGRIAQERAIAKAQDALRQAQKMEAVGQLTSGIAHDFNNLLAVIAGGLQLIKRKPGGAHEVIHDGMAKAIQRGANLTRQLLAFSRTRSVKLQPTDISSRIAEIRDLLDRSLGELVTVEVSIPADIWVVDVDETELETALLNLCVNARDAMPDGGTIRITAVNLPAGPDRGDSVQLSVRDTGGGMPPEVAQRAFEPFFTTKPVGKGTGLGLAQVYGFAKQSGGLVEITSEIGSGTEVVFTLPRSEAVAMVSERVSASVEVDHVPDAGQTILLVEDDPSVAAMTQTLLQEIGYRVVHIASVVEALSALMTGAVVDLVLSDIMTPGGVSGVELARRIKRERPSVPIVLTTGFENAAEGAEELGVPVLLKPYDLVQLERVLKSTQMKPRD